MSFILKLYPSWHKNIPTLLESIGFKANINLFYIHNLCSRHSRLTAQHNVFGISWKNGILAHGNAPGHVSAWSRSVYLPILQETFLRNFALIILMFDIYYLKFFRKPRSTAIHNEPLLVFTYTGCRLQLTTWCTKADPILSSYIYNKV